MYNSIIAPFLQAMQDGQGVVIDLDFDEHMTESELKSLCGQLQYSYSSNTRAAVPCHLYFTSMQVSCRLQHLSHVMDVNLLHSYLHM